MIDKNVFDELLDRRVVTHVGAKASDFDGIEDLQNRGFVTSTFGDEIYNDIVSEDNEMVSENVSEDNEIVVDDNE
jgi:hypothetical protein